jgi:transcriptional regulator GlxA family with amidase domain
MSLTHNDLAIVAQISTILNKEYKYRHLQSRLADRFDISDRKLRKIFKQVTGKTINDFLTAVRIENAKELLRETDDPIKKIASSVGYHTRRGLEKQFKYLIGTTPLDWRNNNRKTRIAS